MKIKVKKEEFIRMIQRAQGIVERKSTMPILSNILLETSSAGVDLSATDLEVGFKDCCSAEVMVEGVTVISGRKLYEIIKELPEEVIDLWSEENKWLKIQAGASEFKIVGMNKEDFPAIPTAVESQLLTLSSQLLREMIRKTIYATGESDTRYVLNGICLNVITKEGNLILDMVGTDGHRLALTTRALEGMKVEEQKFIIPKKTMAELRKLIDEKETANVSIGFNKNHILFRISEMLLSSTLIDGTYPNYHQVIPKENEKVVTAVREKLLSSLKRVSILAREKTNTVRIDIDKSRMMLSTESETGEAKETIPVDYQNEPLTIGFNARYLIDALQVIDGEMVRVELKDSQSPCLIRGSEDEGYIAIVMPLRL
ncbi:MAG: DNA polymerase III subunit beta [Nitrospirota bacterium]